MRCPACEADMIVVEYSSIELDYCTRCKGVWFDSGELELLLGLHDLEKAGSFLGNILSSEEAVTAEKRRKCPICGRRMRKTTIGEQPRIIIDACDREHGLWFDGGEVSQLVKHLTKTHLPQRSSEEHVIGFFEELFEVQK